jgi:hypothetical protein
MTSRKRFLAILLVLSGAVACTPLKVREVTSVRILFDNPLRCPGGVAPVLPHSRLDKVPAGEIRLAATLPDQPCLSPAR